MTCGDFIKYVADNNLYTEPLSKSYADFMALHRPVTKPVGITVNGGPFDGISVECSFEDVMRLLS